MLAMKWVINEKGRLAACWINHGLESSVDTFRVLPGSAPFRARVRRSKPGLIRPWDALRTLVCSRLTWPTTPTFQVTWGVGAVLPVYQWDFPQTVGPIFTVTFYFNGKYGRRGD
ncbi:MAG TPA: hypothetical protein VNF45_05545 [Candidatus Binataceae bacterium]|nr:hypothetical protein [Candidatus Binataceae bacterium]